MANEPRRAGAGADLPITARRDEILEALERHQVLIVAGDTGSGKSTQLPQYCLAIGRGTQGLIAHTQPRRLAARALAARVADELSRPVGEVVGFRVRFADRVSESTRLVLLTDGLLLAELAADPLLRRYDTIIVDEAHERTLNIDLLLGVLRRLLPRRPDLKVIITSATLEVERVSRFFFDAPIIRVNGRSHPIEVTYAADVDDEDDPDLPLEILQAYRSMAAGSADVGDVLVFLPGEREIRDVGDLLERELAASVDVLPLYSRLSWEQQSRIFQPGPRRRIVLATNVAETSITVPGIRGVIDSGLVRVSRYSPRSRLQRLPIEPISRASAEQRKGRCGRLGPGHCVRLYTQADFEARPAFTEPEVLRTNLAALLLRLAADGLGDAEEFPFIDPPDARALGDGYRLLQELAAFDADRRITRCGRAMARLPLDPRLARALLESKRFNAQTEVLAIVSGLSVPDVRLATLGGGSGGSSGSGSGSADQAASAPFEDARSEFSGLVKLWRAYRATRAGPKRELRKWCRERGLSLLRMSEWEDVHAQVTDRAAQIGIAAQPRPASYTGVHRALLAGFCTMVGSRGDEGVYLGTRGVKFHIFPGSPLRRRRPRWLMAANLVETSRVFARCVAEIEPKWIEGAAHHLLKREFLEPDWDEVREEVVARERVSFFGLVLSANRMVNYGPIAPEEARRIFSREALVYQRLGRRPDWLQENDRAIRRAQHMEERLRVRDLVQPAEAFVSFYDKALPRQVSSGATLEHFTRHLSAAQLESLRLGPTDIFAREPDVQLLAQFPERVALPPPDAAGLASPVVSVEYRFAPGEPGDGATLRIPLLLLPNLTQAAVDASVPGLAAPRVEALLRSLPKEARRGLIPMSTTVAAFMAHMGAPSTDVARLADWLQNARSIPPSLVRFDQGALPPHLRLQLAVMGATSAGDVELARGHDLGVLRRRCAVQAREALDRLAAEAYPGPWRRFIAEELPSTVPLDAADGALTVFTALRCVAAGVEVRYEWSREEAAHTTRAGAPRLARFILERQARDLARVVAADISLSLAAGNYLESAELVDALLQQAFRTACFADGRVPYDRAGFAAAVDGGRERLHPILVELMALARGWFATAREVRRLHDEARVRGHGEAVEESGRHLRELLCAENISTASAHELRQLARYLKAEQRRWQRYVTRGNEAAAVLRELAEWRVRANGLHAQVDAELRWLAPLDEFDAMLEEFRVSTYAQEIGTSMPVSAARLQARAAQIDAWITR